MEQNKSREPSLRLQDGAVVLLSVAVIVSTLVLYHHLALGLTLSAGIMTIYRQLTRKNTRNALVLAVLWTVLATAVYTSMLQLILPTAILCLVCYAVWQKSQQN